MPNDKSRSGCLFSVFRLLGIRFDSPTANADELPFRQRDDFLSRAERSFFGVLQQVVGDLAVICPKVRVLDLLFVVDRNSNMGHVNRMDRRHVDFVLCSTTDVRPVLVIELDDASHKRSDRQQKDKLLDRAFEAAGLPLMRFPAQRQYNINALAAKVEPYLNAAEDRLEPALSGLSESALPNCPKCGVPMVRRTARRGSQAGKPFYGCPHYPQCRTTVPIVE